MKKFIITTIVLLSVGLAMVLVGSILQGVNWSTADFNGDPFASALTTIGYLVAVLSGVVLTGLGECTNYNRLSCCSFKWRCVDRTWSINCHSWQLQKRK